MVDSIVGAVAKDILSAKIEELIKSLILYDAAVVLV